MASASYDAGTSTSRASAAKQKFRESFCYPADCSRLDFRQQGDVDRGIKVHAFTGIAKDEKGAACKVHVADAPVAFIVTQQEAIYLCRDTGCVLRDICKEPGAVNDLLNRNPLAFHSQRLSHGYRLRMLQTVFHRIELDHDLALFAGGRVK